MPSTFPTREGEEDEDDDDDTQENRPMDRGQGGDQGQGKCLWWILLPPRRTKGTFVEGQVRLENFNRCLDTLEIAPKQAHKQTDIIDR